MRNKARGTLTQASRNEFELHFQDDKKAGANMAEFAIRSLSTMAYRNPQIQISGLVPYLGTSLNILWRYVIPLCVCIVAAQVALSIAVYVFDVDPNHREER